VGVYGRFLMLPVPVVLGVLWVVGGALLGLCALAPFFLWAVLA
jgi:hypothetical protein